MGAKVQIVLARVEMDCEVDPTAPMARVDLGQRPKMRQVAIAKACMWLNRGTEKDVAKAQAYAPTEGYKVYTFPTSERNAMALAKAAALKNA